MVSFRVVDEKPVDELQGLSLLAPPQVRNESLQHVGEYGSNETPPVRLPRKDTSLIISDDLEGRRERLKGIEVQNRATSCSAVITRNEPNLLAGLGEQLHAEHENDSVPLMNVLSSVDSLKALFFMLFLPGGKDSVVVHRVGNTFVLDEGILRQQNKKPTNSSAGREAGSGSSEHPLQETDEKAMFEALLDKSLQLGENGGSTKRSKVAKKKSGKHSKKAKNRMPLARTTGTEVSRSTSDSSLVSPEKQKLEDARKAEEEAASRVKGSEDTFRRILVHQLENWKLIVGSDNATFQGNESRSHMSLKLIREEAHLDLRFTLDLYLENLLSRIDETALCLHRNGTVLGYKLVKTADLFSITGAQGGITPSIIQEGSLRLLRWIYDSCRDGSTYIVQSDQKDRCLRIVETSQTIKTTDRENDNDKKAGTGRNSEKRSAIARMYLRLAKSITKITSDDVGRRRQSLLKTCFEYAISADDYYTASSALEEAADTLVARTVMHRRNHDPSMSQQKGRESLREEHANVMGSAGRNSASAGQAVEWDAYSSAILFFGESRPGSLKGKKQATTSTGCTADSDGEEASDDEGVPQLRDRFARLSEPPCGQYRASNMKKMSEDESNCPLAVSLTWMLCPLEECSQPTIEEKEKNAVNSLHCDEALLLAIVLLASAGEHLTSLGENADEKRLILFNREEIRGQDYDADKKFRRSIPSRQKRLKRKVYHILICLASELLTRGRVGIAARLLSAIVSNIVTKVSTKTGSSAMQALHDLTEFSKEILSEALLLLGDCLLHVFELPRGDAVLAKEEQEVPLRAFLPEHVLVAVSTLIGDLSIEERGRLPSVMGALEQYKTARSFAEGKDQGRSPQTSLVHVTKRSFEISVDKAESLMMACSFYSCALQVCIAREQDSSEELSGPPLARLPSLKRYNVRLGNALNMTGQLLLSKKRLTTARKYFLEAMKTFQRVGDFANICLLLCNLSKLYCAEAKETKQPDELEAKEGVFEVEDVVSKTTTQNAVTYLKGGSSREDINSTATAEAHDHSTDAANAPSFAGSGFAEASFLHELCKEHLVKAVDYAEEAVLLSHGLRSPTTVNSPASTLFVDNSGELWKTLSKRLSVPLSVARIAYRCVADAVLLLVDHIVQGTVMKGRGACYLDSCKDVSLWDSFLHHTAHVDGQTSFELSRLLMNSIETSNLLDNEGSSVMRSRLFFRLSAVLWRWTKCLELSDVPQDRSWAYLWFHLDLKHHEDGVISSFFPFKLKNELESTQTTFLRVIRAARKNVRNSPTMKAEMDLAEGKEFGVTIGIVRGRLLNYSGSALKGGLQRLVAVPRGFSTVEAADFQALTTNVVETLLPDARSEDSIGRLLFLLCLAEEGTQRVGVTVKSQTTTAMCHKVLCGLLLKVLKAQQGRHDAKGSRFPPALLKEVYSSVLKKGPQSVHTALRRLWKAVFDVRSSGESEL